MPRIPPRTGAIKKGEVRNPKGTSAKARAHAQLRRMTADDAAELINMLFVSTDSIASLADVAKDPTTSRFQKLTAVLLLHCQKKGDVRGMLSLLEIIVGKPKERIEHTGKDGGPIRTAQQTEAEMLAEIAQLQRARLQIEAGEGHTLKQAP